MNVQWWFLKNSIWKKVFLKEQLIKTRTETLCSACCLCLKVTCKLGWGTYSFICPYRVCMRFSEEVEVFLSSRVLNRMALFSTSHPRRMSTAEMASGSIFLSAPVVLKFSTLRLTEAPCRAEIILGCLSFTWGGGREEFSKAQIGIRYLCPAENPWNCAFLIGSWKRD